MQQLRLSNPEGLIGKVYASTMTRAELAALAPLVFELSAGGDPAGESHHSRCRRVADGHGRLRHDPAFDDHITERPRTFRWRLVGPTRIRRTVDA